MTVEIRADLDLDKVPHVKEIIEESFNPMPIPVWNQLRLAAKASDREMCGFIDNRWNLHFVKNSHWEPERHFLMDINDYKKVIERIYVAGERIIGVFHTHPSGNPKPSSGDIAGWPDRDLGWRYFISTESNVHEYEYVNQPKVRRD